MNKFVSAINTVTLAYIATKPRSVLNCSRLMLNAPGMNSAPMVITATFHMKELLANAPPT
jgi:hypothetical protein